MNYVYKSELYHHGIKGQKWGVRRFQNKDGSLTAEGYQHWGLNPDGSKFRGMGFHKKQYSAATASSARKGAAIGVIARTALGASLGPAGSMIGANIGLTVGGMTGLVAGTYKTRKMQKKIRKLLDENGTVYVKDL